MNPLSDICVIAILLIKYSDGLGIQEYNLECKTNFEYVSSRDIYRGLRRGNKPPKGPILPIKALFC